VNNMCHICRAVEVLENAVEQKKEKREEED